MTDLHLLHAVGKTLSVLVVDDEVSSVAALAHILERFFACVQTAENAENALVHYREKGGFDIVITDMCMPPTDGFELSKIIRGMCPRQKIIMVSGSREKAEWHRAQEVGIDAFITKPIDLDQMYQVLYQVASAIQGEQKGDRVGDSHP